MHTFKGPKGASLTKTHGGAVTVEYQGHALALFSEDLLAFADHVRECEDGGTDQEEQDDRERVAFIRREAGRLRASVQDCDADHAVDEAKLLWDALQRAGC